MIEATIEMKCLRCNEEWSIAVFARDDYSKEKSRNPPCPYCDSEEVALKKLETTEEMLKNLGYQEPTEEERRRNLEMNLWYWDLNKLDKLT